MNKSFNNTLSKHLDNDSQPKDEWKNTDDDSQIKTICNKKIVVIAPKELRNAVIPLFCPVCEFPMKTREDGVSFISEGCCEPCDNQWRSTRKKLNLSYEEIKSSKEWKQYLKKRLTAEDFIIRIK